MRAGWTIIELIFILILIGILASIAIPKLAAVRDDAKLSADVSNMAVCIRDAGADVNNSSSSDACDQVVCYAIETNTSSMKVDLNTSAAPFCADIEYVGGHLVVTYKFSGLSVQR